MFGQIKELNGKKKIEYFLEYYGALTAGAIAVCAIIIFLIVHFVGNKTIVSGILAVNCDGDHINAVEDTYFDGYLEEMGFDPFKSTMTVNCRFYVKPDYEDQVTRSTMQTIQTMFVTRAMDVFLADEEFFLAEAQNDYLIDLSEVLSEEEIKRHEEDLVYAVNAVTNQRYLAGIRTSNSCKWVSDTGWYRDGAIIGLTQSMKSEELAIGILKRAIGEK